MKKTTLLLILTVLTGLTTAAPIKLKSGTVNPEKQPELATQSLDPKTDNQYFFIQFKNTPTQKTRSKLQQKNVKLLNYIPENTYYAKTSSPQEARKLDAVKHVLPLQAKHKISPSVQDNSKLQTQTQSQDTGLKEIQLTTFPTDKNRFKQKLQKHAKILHTPKYTNTWTLKTTSTNITDLATLPQTKWITETPPPPTTLNDQSRQLIGANTAQQTPYNLTGKGYTAAIWDGGWAGLHEDLNYTLNWAGTRKTLYGDSYGSYNHHATHVAGTMAGGGILDYTYRGIAHDARITSYEWPDNSDELLQETQDSVSNYNSILSQNSWGYGINDSDSNNNNDHDIMGSYTFLAKKYDNITHGGTSIDPITVTFAAGNEGNNINTSENTWDSRYNTTLPPGATAKNVITVGAVDDSGEMTSYSSWGPTDDGRIKPDLVADGGSSTGYIFSTVPSSHSAYPYGGMAGTSMAAPAVSGAVILLHEQFNETFGRDPAPATTKGVLIHTAEDLNRTGPDYITGWGLVNITAAADYVMKSDDKNLIQKGTLSQGEKDTYNLDLSSGGVNVTLVWSDHPGTLSTTKALINDLDLVVKNESGHRFYPWTLSWENRTQKASRTHQDHKNNVVEVYIPEGAGDVTVTVNGTNVSEPTQSYSLMLPKARDLTPSITVHSPENTTYTSTDTLSFNISSDKNLSSASYSIDGKGNVSLRKSGDYWNNSQHVKEGSHTVTFYANNSEAVNSTSLSFTVDTEAPSLNVTSPANNSIINNRFSLNATVSDSGTGVKYRNYTFNLGTLSGSFNDTVDPLEKNLNGEYTIIFEAEDGAGHVNSSKIYVDFNTASPNLTVHEPAPNSFHSGQMEINYTTSDADNLSKTNLTLENGTTEILFNKTFSSGPESFQKNLTVDTTGYNDGEYNLSFKSQDNDGNWTNKTLSVTFDNTKPTIYSFTPGNGANLSGTENLNISVTETNLESKNYIISNGTEQASGSLNDTYNFSRLNDGEYNITVNVTDKAGNFKNKTYQVTVDNTPPAFSNTTPGSPVKGEKWVNASLNDATTGVNTSSFRLSNGSFSYIGEINSTYNFSKNASGEYNLTFKATDYAENTGEKTVTMTIDHQKPNLTVSSPVNNANVSGSFTPDVNVSDLSGVTKEYRWYSDTGNVTGWKDVTEATDTKALADGNYTVEFHINDTLGNLAQLNVTDVNVDNTKPELNFTAFNESQQVDGWWKDSRKVQVECSDAGTGVEETFFGSHNSTNPTKNFTASDNGENSYSYGCRDYAGNQNSSTVTYKIDGQEPELSSAKPEDGATVDTSFTAKLSFGNEKVESGINQTASNFSVSAGEIDDVDWDEYNATVDVSGLSAGSSFELRGEIADRVGHVNDNFKIDYETEKKTSKSGGSGSKGGSGLGGGKTLGKDSKTKPSFSRQDDTLRISGIKIQNGESTSFNVKNQGTFTEMQLRASSDKTVSVTVKEREEASPGEQTKTYKSFEIDTNKEVSATVSFTVPNNWIQENNVQADRVNLYRMHNGWNKLNTEHTGGNSTHENYEAELPGFSTFTIAADTSCMKRTFDAVKNDQCKTMNRCSVPNGWKEVESCESWNEKEKLSEIIANLSEKAGNKEKQLLKKARTELSEGNVSGARQLIEEVQQKDSEPGSTLPVLPIIIALIVVAVLGFGGYKFLEYQRKQEYIERMEELRDKASDSRSLEKLEQAEEKIKDGEFEDAAEDLEHVRSRIDYLN
ncbi:MAG: S8 family serine peptidase [Candidatus Nanohaloarchaea archaeon]